MNSPSKDDLPADNAEKNQGAKVSKTKPISAKDSANATAYWSKSLKIVGFILSIWLFISLGCGVLFRDFLDSAVPSVGGAPFGFWMAQQGSIIGFVLLLFLYMFLMNGLDRKYGFGDEEQL